MLNSGPLVWLFPPMIPPNATGHSNPAQPAPPPGFMELLSMLVQNGSLPALALPASPTGLSVSPPGVLPPNVSPLPAEGRSFNRVGRGQGGALTEKLKVSKQITASATKRKSLVDPDLEVQSPSTLDSTGKNLNAKPAKRVRSTKVRDFLQSFTDE